MARKTCKTPSRIFCYGARAPQGESAPLVHDLLFLANHYANQLVEIEHDRLAAYQAKRGKYVPDLAAAELAYAVADKEVEDLFDELREHRAAIYRRTKVRSLDIPDDLRAALAAAKTRRTEASKCASGLRKVFEATLKPAREEYRRRCTEEKKANVSPSGKVAPSVAARINRDVYAAMAAEPEWPQAWRDLCEIDEQAHAAKELARSKRPFGYTIGGLVEEAVSQGIKDSRPAPPKFRRFSGVGRIGGQVLKCTALDLFTGKHPTVRLTPQPPKLNRKQPGGARHQNEFYTFSLKVGNITKKDQKTGQETTTGPHWIHVPVRLHRPIPEDAEVKRAWLSVWREGNRLRYEVQFTLNAESFLKPKPNRPIGVGRVALNFGWRMLPDNAGTRVAYWQGDSGEHGSIVLRGKLTNGTEHADRLRHHAGEHFHDVLTMVADWAALAGNRFTWLSRMVSARNLRGFTQWVRAFVEHRLGQDRRTQLWKLWCTDRLGRGLNLFAYPEVVDGWARANGLTEAADVLALWLYFWVRKDMHLRQYEADQRRRSLAQREAVLHAEAVRLSTQFGRLIIDDTDYAKLAKNVAADEEDTSWDKARAKRQASAPGRTREIFREVFGASRTLKVSAKNNSRFCATCDTKLTGGIGSMSVLCATHGDLDVDRNNCLNMLRRADQGPVGDAGEPEPSGERSGDDNSPGPARDSENDAGDAGFDTAAE